MRSRKRQMKEGIELPNQEKIWTFDEKETYQFLTLEADNIEQSQTKEKI